MAKYKVIVLGVQGINNKVYGPDIETKHGRGIVTDDMFPEGNAEKLVKEGKLLKLTDKKQEAKEKAAKEKILKTAIVDAEDKLEDAQKALKNADDATEEDLAAFNKTVEDAEFALMEAKEALENL